MSKNIAIIFAGGSGARMGAGIPKQFIEVNGKPIIIHTLDVFEEHDEIDSIYVACKSDYIAKLKRYIRRFYVTKVAGVVPGGATGQDSIYNALQAAAQENGGDAIVLVHDGVRPFITERMISENIRSVEKYGSAVTCMPFYETPVVSTDGDHVEQTPSRSAFFTAQAPQSFRLSELLEAHEKIRKVNPGYEGIVDSCTLMRSVGKEIAMVEGSRGNIKVTTPEDLYTFRAMLDYRETMQVFGLGEREIEGKLKK